MFLINSIISEFVIGILLCITLGMILYIVLFELIPHVLHAPNKKISLLCILLGFIIVIVSSLFE